MTDIIDRYVYQVGRYVAPKERADIQAELRSQIQDQLDDRFGESPTEDDIVATLKALGDPRTMAASYGTQQYLVGPELYPLMMHGLRIGLMVVPTVVVIVSVVAAVFSENYTVIGLLFSTIVGALQASIVFVGIVVLVFAVLQYEGTAPMLRKTDFNPGDLPPVAATDSTDQSEIAVTLAFTAFELVILLYFIAVGGLTLRINLSNPGAVIPAPMPWMVTLSIILLVQIGILLLVVGRNRWTFGQWVANSLLDLAGVACLYFVLFQPLFSSIADRISPFRTLPFLDSMPILITLTVGLVVLLTNIQKAVVLWGARGVHEPVKVRPVRQ